MPSVVVLNDSDEDFKENRPHHDIVRLLFKTDTGVRATLLRELNTCQVIGAIHCVATDAARGRIYLREFVSNRLTAASISEARRFGKSTRSTETHWRLIQKTGNLWCTTGVNLKSGETVVLDVTGREVASFPAQGTDIAYDPHTDSFWAVGAGITKLSREGKVLFHKAVEGWACVSVAPNPRDGSVWIVEREHFQVERSVNRLWHLAADGTVIKIRELGERRIFGVACEPETGTAWVVSLRSEILRFTANGEEMPALPVKAVSIAVSPTTGQVWATTETEAIELDRAGRAKTVARFEIPSEQSWLAAF